MVISKNLAKSLFDFLDAPSAMLEGIHTLARLNWLVSPNFSSWGNFAVIS